MDDYHNMTVNIVIPDYAAVFVDASRIWRERMRMLPRSISRMCTRSCLPSRMTALQHFLLKTALINTRKLNKTLQDMLTTWTLFAVFWNRKIMETCCGSI